jgi:thioredoxin 1
MNILLIVFAILLVAIVAFRFIVMARIKKAPLAADHENIITLTVQNFSYQTKNRLVLVDFWAAWCAPCRMMAPVLNEVAAALQGNAYVGKADIEAHPALAQQNNVRNIPTLILFKNGKEVARFVGVKSKDFLLKEIAKFE